MKKSMIATAVVATAGLAASANAGYWTISGANYQNGGTNNIAISKVDNQVNTWVSSNFTGPGTVAGQETLLSTSGVTNSLTNLNVSLAANTLTYFGFEDTASGPGFFGIAFKNTSGSSYYFNLQAGSQAAGGTKGVLTSHSGTVGFGNSWSALGTTVTTGSTLLVMFGGLAAGQGFDFQAQSLNSTGTAAGASFAISYLNWGGAAYSQVASAATATTSGLNTALYAVPVPAPALLAGAGLVGAAALRRRMAKKA
jgi:hypothetical protein